MTDNNQLPPLPRPFDHTYDDIGKEEVACFSETQMQYYAIAAMAKHKKAWLEHFNRAWMRVPERIRKEVCADDDGDGYDYLADAVTSLAALAQRQGDLVVESKAFNEWICNSPHAAFLLANRVYVWSGWAARADLAAPATAEQPAEPVTDALIREVFMRNGFTIKEGQTDLKPYVYAAARALLAVARGNL